MNEMEAKVLNEMISNCWCTWVCISVFSYAACCVRWHLCVFISVLSSHCVFVNIHELPWNVVSTDRDHGLRSIVHGIRAFYMKEHFNKNIFSLFCFGLNFFIFCAFILSLSSDTLRFGEFTLPKLIFCLSARFSNDTQLFCKYNSGKKTMFITK